MSVAEKVEGKGSIPRVAKPEQPFFNSRSMARFGLYALAITLSIWIIVPLYLITVVSFSTRDAIFNFPKAWFPNPISTDTLQFFLDSRGVMPSVVNSLVVGLI